MNKKLSERQILDLYTFCEEQGIEYYDVQIELVDHLASAIEDLWEENPKLKYTDALWKVYYDFGVSGFAKVRKSKEKALRRKYGKQQRSYILQFFRIPKIIITAAIFVIMLTIIQSFLFSRFVYFLFAFSPVVFYLVYMFYLYPKYFKISLANKKKFLLFEHQKMLNRAGFAVVFTPIHFLNFYLLSDKNFLNIDLIGNSFSPFIIAFFMTLFFIALSGMYIYIPQRIKNDFKNEFPQFIKLKYVT